MSALWACVFRAHTASAYSLPALNGVSSHTHFCLFAAFFSFLEPGGEAKRLGKKRGGGGAKNFSVFYFSHIHNTSNRAPKGRERVRVDFSLLFRERERGCCQTLCSERKIDHRTSFSSTRGYSGPPQNIPS